MLATVERHTRLAAPCLGVSLIEELGFPVHPVKIVTKDGKRKKVPATTHGFHDATIDVHQAREWQRQFPGCLWAYPTSANTTVVLDVDGPHGLASLAALCASQGIEHDGDLTPVRVRSMSGGLHLHFRLRDGEMFGTRAGDIWPGLDTRGVKEGGAPSGYIIAPGNPGYEHVGESRDLQDAPPVPLFLQKLAGFNKRERAEIKGNPELAAILRDSPPADWGHLMREYRARRFAEIMARAPAGDGDAARRQALADLHDAANRLAALTDGRRNALFYTPCAVSKYVFHGALTEADFFDAFLAAAHANGLMKDYGEADIRDTLRRALAKGEHDPLPPIANRFRAAKGGVR